MAELDKARAALAAPGVSNEDAALLVRYAPDRTPEPAATPDTAAAWAAHLAAHKAQKAVEPTLKQETAAVEAALRAWDARGADARFDRDKPDRLLRFRVAEQNGGRPALRAYLESLGFKD